MIGSRCLFLRFSYSNGVRENCNFQFEKGAHDFITYVVGKGKEPCHYFAPKANLKRLVTEYSLFQDYNQ